MRSNAVFGGFHDPRKTTVPNACFDSGCGLPSFRKDRFGGGE